MSKVINEKEYIPPTVTVDGIYFRLLDSRLEVLLIKRSKEPFKDKYALPGGYCARGETTQDALKRITAIKAGFSIDNLEHLEQLYTFDAVSRDPRGHAVAVTYMGLGRDINIEPSKTTEQPGFFPVDNLPDLAYDHLEIIGLAHRRLKSKISYTNIVFSLIPIKFSYTKLQSAYQAIFGYDLDKRNFRKKFNSLNLIKDTGEISKEGAHRPAKLYSFKEQEIEELTRSFD